MPVSPQAEALVQLARKRRILDRAGCARLRILLSEHRVSDVAGAREFLGQARLLPAGPAQQLLSHLPPPEGMNLGQYRVLAHLADGGMGSVWLAVRDAALTPQPTPTPDASATVAVAPAASASARHSGEWTHARPLPEPDQLVVVKTMKGQFAGNDEVRRRFNRECRYMAQIDHASVVAILDHGATEDGTLFMVLEFVETGDLKELVELSGALSEALALAFAHQVADALHEAHVRRLIHRDIKPANIFASPEGTCQLADFGIARSTSTERTQLTMEGTLVGSPAYMSPEQVMAEKDLDIRSDLYALGCVLFYCLTGAEPYHGRLQEVLHMHRTAPIPDPRANRPGLTVATAMVVRKLMAKKREERFQTPAELRVALAEALAALGTGGSTSTTSAPAPTAAQPPLDRTITCDLLAEDKAAGTSSDSHPTVKVGPDGEVDIGATMAVAAGDWSGVKAGVMTSAVRTPAPVDAPPERFDGELSRALDAPWLALVGDGCHVLLYARRQVTLGKLCEAPVDICLRKHPTTAFRDDCLRISRQHLQLRYDAPSARLLLTDLGSGNGTLLDGAALPPNSPHAISGGSEHRVFVAGALQLILRATAARGGASQLIGQDAGSPGECGIDTVLPFDAAVLQRPDNRPGMAYALVLRRVSIGAAGADLVLPHASGVPAELALWRGRWIWRNAGAWLPLTDGATVTAGGKQLKVRLGGYDIFQTEG